MGDRLRHSMLSSGEKSRKVNFGDAMVPLPTLEAELYDLDHMGL
jgi:hypothetical protein